MNENEWNDYCAMIEGTVSGHAMESIARDILKTGVNEDSRTLAVKTLRVMGIKPSRAQLAPEHEARLAGVGKITADFATALEEAGALALFGTAKKEWENAGEFAASLDRKARSALKRQLKAQGEA